MAQVLGAMGIRETDSIVIAGDAESSWGGEGWIAWMLTWMGHKGEISLLSGGTRAWKLEGGTMVNTSENNAPTRYRAELEPSV